MESTLLTLAICIVWGIVGALMAEKRNRNKALWFFICFLFGIIGIAILAILGKDKKTIVSNDGDLIQG